MLTTLPASAPQDEIFAVLERDGGVIVSDLLSPATVDGLMGDFNPILDGMAWGNSESAEPDEFFGNQTKRLHGLLAKSAHIEDVVSHPLLLAMARHRLGVGERTFDVRLSTCELMCIGPGQEVQSFHRDIDAWPFLPLTPPRPEGLISANIAMDDFTVENGATLVVPGSHKWPAERRAEPDEVSYAVMKRGSALLYSGEVIHAGGANVTDASRTGLYVGYLASWIRPTENLLQTNGAEAISRLPEDLQRLFNVVPKGFTLIA